MSAYTYTIKLKDKATGALSQVRKKGGKAYSKLQKGQQRLNKITKKFGPISSKVFAGVGVASVGIMTKKIIDLTNKTANSLDELAKMGNQVGMSATKLKAYQFAAERSGIATNTFNAAMESFNKRVGELKAGTGSLLMKLQKMGKKGLIENLKAAGSTEEAFKMMSKTIHNASGKIEKNTLASAAFSKSNMKMVRMMASGNKEMQRLVKYSIKQTGNLDKAAKMAEKYKNAQTNMNNAMFGLRTIISGELMPIFMKYIKQLTKWIRKNKELIASKIKGFIEGVANAVKFLVNNIDTIIPLIKTLTIVLGGLTAASYAAKFAAMSLKRALISTGVGALIVLVGMLIANWKEVTAAVKKFGEWSVRVFSGIWNWVSSLSEKIGMFFKFLWYKVTGQNDKAQEAKMKMKGIKLGEEFQKGFKKGQKKQKGLIEGNPLLNEKSLQQQVLQKIGDKKKQKTPAKPTTPTHTTADTPATSGTSAVTSGGKQQKNINVTFDCLVKELQVAGADFDESVDNMEGKLSAALLRVLNSANEMT